MANYIVAYKALNNDMSSFWNNFIYEMGKTYKVLDVDMSDTKWSYGLNVCKDAISCLVYGKRIFKVHIPKDCKIKYIEGTPKFRCEQFTLVEEVNINEYIANNWSELTEYQKNNVCANNPNFDYEKYWDELTEVQKNNVCITNSDFNYEKYWSKLTEEQRGRICRYNPNFDYEKYWNILTQYQKKHVYSRVVIEVN